MDVLSTGEYEPFPLEKHPIGEFGHSPGWQAIRSNRVTRADFDQMRRREASGYGSLQGSSERLLYLEFAKVFCLALGEL